MEEGSTCGKRSGSREGPARRRDCLPSALLLKRHKRFSYAGVLNMDSEGMGKPVILQLPLLYESDSECSKSRHVGIAGISNASPKTTTVVKCKYDSFLQSNSRNVHQYHRCSLWPSASSLLPSKRFSPSIPDSSMTSHIMAIWWMDREGRWVMTSNSASVDYLLLTVVWQVFIKACHDWIQVPEMVSVQCILGLYIREVKNAWAPGTSKQPADGDDEQLFECRGRTEWKS